MESMKSNRDNLLPSNELAAGLDSPERSEGILRIVWRRKWLILLAVSLSVAVGAGYLHFVQPTYESTTQLYIERRSNQLLESGQNLPVNHPANWLPAQCERIKSRGILQAALERPGIAELPTLAAETDKVGYLKEHVSTELVKSHDVIRVRCTAPRAQDAAAIANAVVDAYVERQVYETVRVRTFFQREKARVDEELQKKRKALVAFQLANGTTTFENNGNNLTFRRLSGLSDKLLSAEMELVDATYDYESAGRIVQDPDKVRDALRAIGTRGAMDELAREADIRTELALANEKVRELRAHYQPDHPAVKVAKGAIADLETRLQAKEASLRKAYLSHVRTRYEQAQRMVEVLRQSFRDQKTRSLELNAKAGQYALLAADVKRAERMSDLLDERVKNMQALPDDPGPVRYSVLDRAVPAAHPISPNKVRILLIAMVAGLALGFGLAILMDWATPRLHTAEDVAAHLGLPILGGVPHMREQEGLVGRGQKVLMDPVSSPAEAYRIIRTAVYFGTDRGDFKTLLVTSASPGEGKSTLVSNLGLAMAQAGMRTLIIDADRHKPVQGEIFEIAEEDFYASMPAAGERSLKSFLTRPTGVKNLDILPGGPLLETALKALGTEPFSYLLQQLSKHYDRILVDSPPVCPLADARAIAAACDATVMVVRIGQTMKKLADLACYSLRGVGANLLGVVLNDVPRSKSYYGYNVSEYQDYRREVDKRTSGKKRRHAWRTSAGSRSDL